MTKPRIRTRVVPTALTGLLVAGVFATHASASWYITQRQARHDTLQVIHERYGLNRSYVDDVECARKFDDFGFGRRYDAPRHRWLCSWDWDDLQTMSCLGLGQIVGSNHAAFRYVVVWGRTCVPYDESD